MDYSAKLDDLQQRAAHARAAAQAAVSESREQLRQRIDQAKVDVDLGKDAGQQVGEAAALSTWAQLKADAAAKLDDFETKMDRRADQRDAKVAARQADGAEADAADAIEFASWTALRNPTNCNRAVPLTNEQSRSGLANAAADHRRRAGPHTVPLLRCRSGHSVAAAWVELDKGGPHAER